MALEHDSSSYRVVVKRNGKRFSGHLFFHDWKMSNLKVNLDLKDPRHFLEISEIHFVFQVAGLKLALFCQPIIATGRFLRLFCRGRNVLIIS